MIKRTLHWIRSETDFWSVSAICIAVIAFLPLGTVLMGLGRPGPEWDHVKSNVLLGYFANTCVLALIVPVLALLFAVPTAWFVTMFEFPGRRWMEWALVVPLALPTYAAAFAYYEGLEQTIPLLVWVKRTLGFEVYLWVEKISRYGLLALLLAAVLYPYIYLSARSSFGQQRRAVIEVAQTLGKSPGSVFSTVALPLARPALVAGTSLVLMEVLNDYGAVHFFGVPTLTVGIFRTWFGLEDRASALSLAGWMMVAIWLLGLAERWQRGNAQYSEMGAVSAPLARRELSPGKGLLVLLACLVPLTLGFLYPVGKFCLWAVWSIRAAFRADYWSQLGVSVILAMACAITFTLVSYWISYATRLPGKQYLGQANRWSTLGYSAPGAVIAVGVMVVLGAWDRLSWLSFVLSGTLWAIVFAYFVRFLAVSYQPVNAGLIKQCWSLDEAARVLGSNSLFTMTRISFPLMRNTLVAAAMLVFVEILKELPLTMILRPANFETLATTAFGLAKEGRIQESAIPSLLLVIAGGGGLIALNRSMNERGD